MDKNICLVSIGKIDQRVIEIIGKEIEKSFNCRIKLGKTLEKPDFAYNPGRKQYYAPPILRELEKKLPDDCIRIVGILDVDIYDDGMNFIFGEASKSACIVSMWRFKPCIYEKEINEKTIERTIKTVIHELGHTFGLSHCNNPKCVMYFSNWIGETDNKSKDFCNRHKNQLINSLKYP